MDYLVDGKMMDGWIAGWKYGREDWIGLLNDDEESMDWKEVMRLHTNTSTAPPKRVTTVSRLKEDLEALLTMFK